MFKVIMRCSAGVQGEGSCSVLLEYAKWHEHLSVLVKWYQWHPRHHTLSPVQLWCSNM